MLCVGYDRQRGRAVFFNGFNKANDNNRRKSFYNQLVSEFINWPPFHRIDRILWKL